MKERRPVEEQIPKLLRGIAEEIPRGGLGKKLEKAAAEGRALRVKLGVDPSAPDLHLGHTVPLRRLKAFQELGHEAIFLIGDFTGLIGDPSGRSATRPQLSKRQVLENAGTLRKQFGKMLDRNRTRVVFNSQWCGKMKFEDVIRLASKYTVARLLERDDFTKRYREGQPIGLHEFLYPLIQGYDSVVLKADVELCATDQIFNCHVGRALQEDAGQDPEVILAVPMLEGTDGVQKMSKSLGNAIGISEPPGDMYGKLLSIPDALLSKYIELLCDEPLGAGLSARDAKHELARVLVSQYHGEKAAKVAAESFERVFVRREAPEEMPEAVLSPGSVVDGRIWPVRLLTETGMAASNSEAQRLIRQGAVELDGLRIDDPKKDVEVKPGAVIKVGKRRFKRIRLS